METIIETLETMLKQERDHKPLNDHEHEWRGAIILGLEQAIRSLHGVACLQQVRLDGAPRPHVAADPPWLFERE